MTEQKPLFQEKVLYKRNLTLLVWDALAILKRTKRTLLDETSSTVINVAACRVADEIKETKVRMSERKYYESFLSMVGLSQTMLPWRVCVNKDLRIRFDRAIEETDALISRLNTLST